MIQNFPGILRNSTDEAHWRQLEASANSASIGTYSRFAKQLIALKFFNNETNIYPLLM